MRDQMLVLSYNNAYAASITARLRAEKICAKIIPGESSIESIIAEEALGFILAGGLSGELPGGLDGQLLRAGIPMLALGDTAAAVALLLGAQIGEKLVINEVDTLTLLPSRITEELTQSERMLGTVFSLQLTEDLVPLAQQGDSILGIMHKTLNIFALQCQLETNDPDMMGLIMRFAQEICGCTKWWGEDAFISAAKAEIIEAAKGGQALCVMSGGLDSGVAALLAHRALDNRLQCLFVDNGLLREQEVEEFAAYYKKAGLNLQIIDAGERFINALAGLTSAGDKTAAVLTTMQNVIDEATQSLPFSLVIESTSGDAMITKGKRLHLAARVTTNLPAIAPLNELFKDEIRLIGEALGMPQEMTCMQSFPWTGLALRVIGECTREKLGMLRRADAVFREEIQTAGLNKRLWKYFAILYQDTFQSDSEKIVLALRAVSVNHQGSEVRAIPARLPYDLLERYTERVLGANPRISKIVYDLTPTANLQQIEWH
jgi:GMP synthase (glutamine-hydrolysing)